VQFTVYFLFLHTPLHGHGSNGDGGSNCKDCESLFDQSMIMLACALAVHGLSMKGLRFVCIKCLVWR
jgi:hypothetical protein